MKKKSVSHSTGVVGTLDVETRKALKANASQPNGTPKPQGSDYRAFLDYKAHAYWALCESQERQAHVNQRQKRRLARKGLSLADVRAPGVTSLPADVETAGTGGFNRGD